MLGSSQESRYPENKFKEVMLVHHYNLEITRKISRKLCWFITNIQKSKEKMKVSSTSLLQAFGNPKKKMKVNIFNGSSLAFGNSKKEMEGSFTCSSPSFLCHMHHKTLTLLMSFNIGKVQVYKKNINYVHLCILDIKKIKNELAHHGSTQEFTKQR